MANLILYVSALLLVWDPVQRLRLFEVFLKPSRFRIFHPFSYQYHPVIYVMKLLRFNSVDFDVIRQVLIKYSAFFKVWRNNWITPGQYINYSDYKVENDSIRNDNKLNN